MQELEFESQLMNLLEGLEDIEDIDFDCNLPVKSVHTYAQAWILSNHKGLVVKMKDGSEFNLMITKVK
jgi:hypothetical protein